MVQMGNSIRVPYDAGLSFVGTYHGGLGCTVTVPYKEQQHQPSHTADPTIQPRKMMLSHLLLRPSTLEALLVAGFEHVSEIEESHRHGIANFAAELQCSAAAAHAIYREVVETANPNTINAQPQARTAVDILQQQQQQRNASIITFSRPVDIMLGGGIPIGELTEIAGAPGTGKTQLAMQLSVNAALRVDLSGVAGETVYIDTEGSFSPERCHSLALSLIIHCAKGLKRNKLDPWNITADDILNGIHVFRVHTVSDLTAVLSGALPALLQEQRRNVKLVVIDSMAFPYRASTTDFVARTRQLTASAAALSQLAVQHQLAVVAINQMTTKIDSSHIPALGESWAHAVTNRLVLTCAPPHSRTCTLIKSPRLPCSSAAYRIVEDGVRGDDSSSSGVKRQKT